MSGTPTISFRIVAPEAAAQLADLMAAYYAFDGHAFDRAKVMATLAEFLADARLGRAWFVCDGDQMIGYMALAIGYSLEFGGRDGFVDEIFIIESRRGQGIGRLALEHMCAEARTLGLKALHLEVDTDNRRAQRLYEALGFEPRQRFHLMSRKL
jgi:ribosomal protein S18 acetylase RimI-like enzyme